MSAHDDPGLALRRHFAETADPRVADGRLEAILDRTRAIAPRPTWLVVARGGATTAMLPAGARQRTMPIVLAALLLLATIALALFIAGQRHPPLRLGLMAFSRGGDVYLAQPDGSDAVQVVHDDAIGFSVRAWSPDGGLVAVEGPHIVFVLDPQTRALRRIAEGTFSGWMPDGRAMLVNASAGARIIAVDGVPSTRVSFDRIDLATLSPDGRSIAGMRYDKASDQEVVVIVDVATGDAIPVGVPTGWGFGIDRGLGSDYPVWSQDSRRIAFLTASDADANGVGDGKTRIAVAERDGSDLTLLRATLGPERGRPSWSPDGAWIAYSAAGDLHVVGPDGSGDRLILSGIVDGRDAEDPYGPDGFRWDPDSSGLTVVRRIDGAFWHVDLESGEARRLSTAELTPASVAWQRLAADRVVPPLPRVDRDDTAARGTLIRGPGGRRTGDATRYLATRPCHRVRRNMPDDIARPRLSGKLVRRGQLQPRTDPGLVTGWSLPPSVAVRILGRGRRPTWGRRCAVRGRRWRARRDRERRMVAQRALRVVRWLSGTRRVDPRAIRRTIAVRWRHEQNGRVRGVLVLRPPGRLEPGDDRRGAEMERERGGRCGQRGRWERAHRDR